MAGGGVGTNQGQRGCGQLRRVEVDTHDRLTRWAIDHLATTADRSLPAMLEAALERRYSASPGEGFFTGGGRHTFGNFNASDNAREPTLREALQASINLPFVRLMREIVRHTMYQVPGSTARLLEDNQDPRRVEYLARFADREGQAFLRRFWRKYQDRSAEEMRSMLLDGLRPGADDEGKRLASGEAGFEAEALAFGLRRQGAEPSVGQGVDAAVYDLRQETGVEQGAHELRRGDAKGGFAAQQAIELSPVLGIGQRGD